MKEEQGDPPRGIDIYPFQEPYIEYLEVELGVVVSEKHHNHLILIDNDHFLCDVICKILTLNPYFSCKLHR
jgi:hypothetical protein